MKPVAFSSRGYALFSRVPTAVVAIVIATLQPQVPAASVRGLLQGKPKTLPSHIMPDVNLSSPIPQPAPMGITTQTAVLDACPDRTATNISVGESVTLTSDNDTLVTAFTNSATLRRVQGMDEMLGITLPVIEMLCDGSVGLRSPDGSQNGTWYFPPQLVTEWEADKDAGKDYYKHEGLKVEGEGTTLAAPDGDPFSAVGSSAGQVKRFFDPRFKAGADQVNIDAKRGYLRAIGKKANNIISVKCLEEMHKNASYVCPPEDYKNGTVPAPPAKPTLSPQEMQQKIDTLKDEVKQLKDQHRMETLTNNAVNNVSKTEVVESVKDRRPRPPSGNSLTKVYPNPFSSGQGPFMIR